MLGRFNGARITLDEVYRFPNGPVQTGKHIYWDVRRLFGEVKKGLVMAAGNGSLVSIGLDAWGNDFCLLDPNGELVENPHSYRDPRTDGLMDKCFQKMPREEIYYRTGVQFMQHNTLFQIYSMVLDYPDLIKSADTYLMMGDLFNYWLCGAKACEFTNATTTQFYDPRAGDWCLSILDTFGIPARIMPPVVQSATRLGTLQPAICKQLNIPALPVIAVGTHDTASAACAVPYSRGVPSGTPADTCYTFQDAAFLSSGTWSLMGAEVGEPLINCAGLQHNFTCYGGVGGAWLVWKNIQALWILQECQRNWAEAGGEDTLDNLVRLAQEAQPFAALIDVDDRLFLTPGDFPVCIADYCRSTGQQPPEGKGAVVRCILESLALKYRYTFERLQDVLGRRLSRIHVIGGGSLNALLNRFTADAVGVPVVAGPAEATAVGNFLAQLMALGEVGSLSQARELVGRSFATTVFQPEGRDRWDNVLNRFSTLIERGNQV